MSDVRYFSPHSRSRSRSGEFESSQGPKVVNYDSTPD